VEPGAITDDRAPSDVEWLTAELERYKVLVRQYRRPMPDGGLTWQERAHTAKVALGDAQALLVEWLEQGAALGGGPRGDLTRRTLDALPPALRGEPDA